MKTWAFVDTKNVMARMFYAMPALAYKGKRVEAIFGLAREVHLISLKLNVPLKRFVFFFDSKNYSYRRGHVPGYKSGPTRGDGYLTGTSKAKEFLESQVLECRRTALPHAGYECHYAKYFEADDLIASACKSLKDGQRAYVISNDSDLLQLLDERVMLYNHRTGQTFEAGQFEKEWGIRPKLWARVKAIAGCDGDNVPGISGIGELLASRFVADPGNISIRLQEMIAEFKKLGRFRDNLAVVKLPFEGTPAVNFKAAEPDWKALCDLYKFKYRHIAGAVGHGN